MAAVTDPLLSKLAVRHAMAELTAGRVVSQEPRLSAGEIVAADRGVHDMAARVLGARASEALEACRSADTRTRAGLLEALAVPASAHADLGADLLDVCAFLRRFAHRASRATPAALADLFGLLVASVRSGDMAAISAYMAQAVGTPRIAGRSGRRRRPRGRDMDMAAPDPVVTVFLGEDATRHRLQAEPFLVVNAEAGVVRTLGSPGASHDLGDLSVSDGLLCGSVLVGVRTGARFKLVAGTGAPITRRGAGAGPLPGRAKKGGPAGPGKQVAQALVLAAGAMVVGWLVAYFTGPDAPDLAEAARSGGEAALGTATIVMRGLASIATEAGGAMADFGTWLLRATANGCASGWGWSGNRFSDLLSASELVLSNARDIAGMPLTTLSLSMCGQMYAESLLRVPWATKKNTAGRLVLVHFAVRNAHAVVMGTLGALVAVAKVPAAWTAGVVGGLGAAAMALLAFWLQRVMAPGLALEDGIFVAEGLNADPQATLLNRAAIDMTHALTGARLTEDRGRAALELAHKMEGCCLMLDRVLDTAYIPQVGSATPRPRQAQPQRGSAKFAKNG